MIKTEKINGAIVTATQRLGYSELSAKQADVAQVFLSSSDVFQLVVGTPGCFHLPSTF